MAPPFFFSFGKGFPAIEAVFSLFFGIHPTRPFYPLFPPYGGSSKSTHPPPPSEKNRKHAIKDAEGFFRRLGGQFSKTRALFPTEKSPPPSMSSHANHSIPFPKSSAKASASTTGTNRTNPTSIATSTAVKQCKDKFRMMMFFRLPSPWKPPRVHLNPCAHSQKVPDRRDSDSETITKT